jgi:hypothetical protein
MGTVIVRTAMEDWRTMETAKKTNYAPFFNLANLRRRGVISREHFILDWGLAQRDQGIKAEDRRP